ncbi:AAA family ATPase [Sorangium sp. So ce291]|uniref:AAA family ATPase n=1 Tax=Sorangium sp. So ce291 TaxID=3133294 RepID=UPI003F5F0C7D
MYLRKVRVQHLKLLRDLTLDFTAPGGGIRNWTVIIGQNGTAKTSLLQAIALAAAGSLQVNTLAGRSIGHLRDRRSDEPLQIDATFEFLHGGRDPQLHPRLDKPMPPTLQLSSWVGLTAGESTIRARAHYGAVKPRADATFSDPLDDARARNTARWFVAGYGVARLLPDVGRVITLDRPSIERMAPLFDAKAALTSTSFSSYFGEGEKARLFHRVLKRALLNVESLLPGIADLELRGYGGVNKPGDLLERDRFLQQIGKGQLKVPGVALAHGYQSTIAWLADLVGHVLLEAEAQFEIDPDDMEGLVLVDEIDLYLHPVWQATLIPALRWTFPKLQFIVTTHSPVVLSGVTPHEIVRLASCGDAGDVVEVVHHPETGAVVPAADVGDKGIRPDTRMMTGSEILREQFGLDRLTPNPEGENLRRYTTLATDPYRTKAEDQEMLRLQAHLREEKITDLPRPVRRKKA